MRTGPPFHPVALAKAPQGQGGEVLALHPGTGHAIHRRAQAAGLELDLVGEGDRLEDAHQLVATVLARRAHVEAEVDLRRRRVVQRGHASRVPPPGGCAGPQPLRAGVRAPPPARGTRRARAARRARRPDGRAAAVPRGRDRGRPGPGRGSARASAPVPCGGGRRRRARGRGPRARAPGRCAPGRRGRSRHWGSDGRRCARSSGARARRTRAGRGRWARRRPACPAWQRNARRPRAGPWPPSA